MNNTAKIAIVGSISCIIGLASSCSAILDFTPTPAQCWCGEQWRAQVSGASSYRQGDIPAEIPASDTSATRCVSMLEHLALNAADPQDPVFVALREALRSEAIANCELAGAAIWGITFDHTDCATADTDPVSFNLVHLGPCWEWENLEADPPQTCPLEGQCGQFYDCSTEPITLWGGQVYTEGETDGTIPWTGDEQLWTCDESPRGGFGSPGDVQR